MIENRAVSYIGPFVTYVTSLGLERLLHVPLSIGYPLRIVTTCSVIWLVSRPVLPRRMSRIFWSASLGAAVFLMWIGPDVLFGYRHLAIFENSITGTAVSSASKALRTSVPFIFCRVFGCAVVVPVVEELFWRGWLMRWLIKQRFELVPLGKYAAGSFWTVAVLFALEHGPYWEVGLVAGIVYNWWMIRTKNLADCMIAHAVTNALLSIYVITADHWEYWY